MNAKDSRDTIGSATAADQPIGEIAAAIERTPPAPKPEANRNPSAVPPIGEIETAIERSKPA